MTKNRTWIGLLAFLLIAAIGYKTYTAHVAASAPAQVNSAAREDLQKFMQSQIHHEYTFLSFTIWHDSPFTPAKMESIVASSSKVMAMANELDRFEATYREQGWSEDDVKFFDDKRVQLSRVAEELNHAAQRQDSTAVTSFFMHMDSTCQSCHKRFRPDLQWI